MSNNTLIAVAIAAFSQSVLAQSPPSGGAQLQQIPSAPTPQKALPDLRIEPSGPAAKPAPAGVRIVVSSVHLTGNTLYPEAELLALADFTPGRELTLAQLRDIAARIADVYHQRGYVVAQAYLPAQDVKGGAVTIAVIEGRYGKIDVRNETNLSSPLVGELLDGLAPGDPVAIAPLENRLLRLSDLPGVRVRSTLAPGVEVGTSDLIVEVQPGRRVTGSVEADNAGNRYTGEYRLGATVNVNGLAGRGDVLSLRALTSGSGLNYGRASYKMQFGKATAGVAYTALQYRLGREFEDLDAHGTAEIASVYGSYPLIRSRHANLYALAGFDAKTFEDEVDLTSSVTDKKARVGWFGVHGNVLDGFGGGGASNYSLTQSFGELDIETPAALAVDAATARSNGHYRKLAYHAARLQRLTDRVSLYGAINGQFASKNLDISEKIGAGGPYAVRAYPVGEAYSDEGYVVNIEARVRLPKFSERIPGQMHFIAFADTANLSRNKNPWTSGGNRRTLSGAGVGLTWAEYDDFVVNAYWAHKLGNAAATSAPDKSGRFWIQLVKYF